MFTDQNRTVALIEDALKTVGNFELEVKREDYYTENGGVEHADDQRLSMFTHELGAVQLINSVVVDWKNCEEPESKHTVHVHGAALGFDVVIRPDSNAAFKLSNEDAMFDEVELCEQEIVDVLHFLKRIREAKGTLDQRKMKIADRIRGLFKDVEPTVSIAKAGTDFSYSYEGELSCYDTDSYTQYDVSYYKGSSASFDAECEVVDFEYVHFSGESVDEHGIEYEIDLESLRLERICASAGQETCGEAEQVDDVSYDERAIGYVSRLTTLLS